MNNEVTVVMYHYVRELKQSQYPEIKGLEFSLFISQLDYMTKHYNFISADDLLNNNELPPNPVLLTFDDGYIDHYSYVLPELVKRKIKGCFFPVVNAALHKKVLDVNKIHFILACTKDKEKIKDFIDHYVIENKTQLGLLSLDEYRAKTIKSRFDTDTVMYIKCMLQRDLPVNSRNYLIESLFNKHVSCDETDFAASLYLNTKQLTEMHELGMCIGVHTVSHDWLATLTEEEQIFEITESIKLLDTIGVKSNELTISYPYGSYNDITLKIVKNHGIKLGFTTKVETANLSMPLELSRYDTNDIPV